MPNAAAQNIAVCLFPLSKADGAASTIQIFPAGEFNVPRGAMRGSGPWRLNEGAAKAIIAKVSRLKTPLVIDYEHQSLLAATNGMPAPAAGWVAPDALTWTDAGLFGAATWTDRAREMIAASEYAFLSPVFTYDEKTGTPTDLLNIALTNNPAIDGMAPVMLAAASRLPQPHEAPPMPLHQAVATLLGVAEDADEAAIVAACQSTADRIKTAEDKIAAASAAVPDPAKFAPVAALTALQDEVAALRAAQVAREIDDLITPALSDGRLNSQLEPWARDLGKKDIAALRAYVEKAQPIAALTGSQTGGKPPEGSNSPKATEDELAVCRAMGIDVDVFLKSKQLEAA